MKSPIEFMSPLSPLLWAVLAGVPVGIIALYFLKLRRRPVQVPSTLLWRRSLEDLHVNSLFQRLRRNLLLFLQLLMIMLVMLAVAGPRISGMKSTGRRYVLLLDNSASMGATDVQPSRLAKAKQEALKVIDGMSSGDLAMIIAFSDRATVVSNYTSNTSELRRRIDTISPTQRSTSLLEGLQVAAGLANPTRQVGEGEVATAFEPPRLMIFTDGGFPDVQGISLGSLEPELIVVGGDSTATDAKARAAAKPGAGLDDLPKTAPSNNVAIVALQTRRNDEKDEEFQVFGRVHNYRATETATTCKLLRLDPDNRSATPTTIDVIELKIPAQSDQSFKFDLPESEVSELEVVVDGADDLPLDNRAFTLIGKSRQAQVLVVSNGNRYLIDALKTDLSSGLSELSIIKPEEYKTGDIARKVASGGFDLVIFDRFQPETAPEANALYFGALPPGAAFSKSRAVKTPVVLDWDPAHPLLQYIRDLPTIVINEAIVAEPPAGTTVLIESDKGPLAFITPRGGFVDAVIGFSLLEGKNFNTNWPVKYSFPLFLFNALRVLGNARETGGDEVNQPGQPITLRPDTMTDRITVETPERRAIELERDPRGSFIFNDAETTGLYEIRWDSQGRSRFAVNLFDARESDLSVRGLSLKPEGNSAESATKSEGGGDTPGSIKIGATSLAGKRASTSERQDWWRPFAMLALVIVLVEWYIYNKRVYL